MPWRFSSASIVFLVACFLVYGVAHILNHSFEVGIVGASSITVENACRLLLRICVESHDRQSQGSRKEDLFKHIELCY